MVRLFNQECVSLGLNPMVIFFIFNDFVKPFLIGMNACGNKSVLTHIFFKKKEGFDSDWIERKI